MQVAHLFVLNNCDEIIEYLDEHEKLMKREHHSHLYAVKHRDLFPRWFPNQVKKLKETNYLAYTDELYNLVIRPLSGGCNDKFCTQNSGVHVPGVGDIANIDFYGKLTSVCCWFNTDPNRDGSVKQDDGLLSVNTTRCWFNEDPYIFATMAKQIFYIDDPKARRGWKVVQRIDHRGVNHRTIPYRMKNGITSSLRSFKIPKLKFNRSPPTPPPLTTTAATAPPPLAPTSEAVSSTSSVTHPLLSAQRCHRQPRPIDEVDEFASASTAVEEGADTELFKGRFTQWKSNLHKYLKRFDESADTVAHGYPLELLTGSKFFEIDTFKEMYVWLGDEFTEGFHVTMMKRSQAVFEEVGSQLPPDTPREERLGTRLGKVYRGMGNARHRETMAVQHKHIATQSAHIATQEAHIVAEKSKMAQIITALQLSGFNIPTATPPLATSTS
ncbi:pentatricopeptide repeat-containing protein [Pyrus ussuriensis x Pyrus communis]|uniref:Pentatricopeptide repeat-containing protein n=1 Tax=Pyrus ussuriensis x Pyrus communis TaxID=2448454 RepID=A0A5N5HN32_9ROSA|nr:pentatricopeptide repeat-containing protein [Pyrus ussuriensis x Pyrus communis]